MALDRTPEPDPPAAQPPTPERRPVRLEAHGDVRIDDWYWLRDKDDPAVIEHLEAENAYTEAVTAATAGLRQGLFEEMVARIEETDLSVPVRKGPWLYYGRTEEGSSYGIHCRRPAPDREGADSDVAGAAGGIPADEVVLLDENLLAEGHEYFAVGNLEVSPDHRWLAYSTDTTGGERYTMRFIDLAGGQASPEALEDTSYGVAWANDNATVFYVRVDEAMRPYQLWRHRVGTDQSGDTLVHEEADDRFYIGVGRTKDDRYILLGMDSKVTSEVRALPADEPEGEFSVIEPRRQGIEYAVDHDRGDPTAGRAGRFLIVTNDGAEDFRLMAAPDASPGRDSWQEVVPARPGVRLDTVDPFAGHLVVYEREGGETRARRRPTAGRSPPPRSGVGPTRSTSRPPCATSTPRSSPPARSTTSTSRAAPPPCGSASRSWVTSTPVAIGPNADGRCPRTGPGCPSPSSTGPTWWAGTVPMSRPPASSTGTGPTRCPSTRPSPRSA
jgi:oligopeptidase B